jgi:hypothetical protein
MESMGISYGVAGIVLFLYTIIRVGLSTNHHGDGGLGAFLLGAGASIYLGVLSFILLLDPLIQASLLGAIMIVTGPLWILGYLFASYWSERVIQYLGNMSHVLSNSVILCVAFPFVGVIINIAFYLTSKL